MEEKIMRVARVLEIIGKRPVGGVGTVMPVSYTHLDVYKRQIRNTIGSIKCFMCFAKSQGANCDKR